MRTELLKTCRGFK